MTIRHGIYKIYTHNTDGKTMSWHISPACSALGLRRFGWSWRLCCLTWFLHARLDGGRSLFVGDLGHSVWRQSCRPDVVGLGEYSGSQIRIPLLICRRGPRRRLGCPHPLGISGIHSYPGHAGYWGIEVNNWLVRFTVRDGVDEDKKLPGSRFVAPYSDGHRSLFRGDMEHSNGGDLVDP